MKNILVAGGGIMGQGIALCAAQNGFDTIVWLRRDEALSQCQAAMERTLSSAVKKNKMTEQSKTEALARITLTCELPAPDSVDAVIEAIAENISEKQYLFQWLSNHFPPSVMLASTTSSLSITAIASQSSTPERCVGMHFFNPVPVMALVEVIRGVRTDEETYKKAVALAEAMKKTPVTVNDSVGFVVSRILVPMINDAAFLLGESVADAESIDTAMMLGANHPMGPLALGDRIGLDVCLMVLDILYEETKDTRFRPAPALKCLVRAGMYGRKTGQGFFTYN